MPVPLLGEMSARQTIGLRFRRTRWQSVRTVGEVELSK